MKKYIKEATEEVNKYKQIKINYEENIKSYDYSPQDTYFFNVSINFDYNPELNITLSNRKLLSFNNDYNSGIKIEFQSECIKGLFNVLLKIYYENKFKNYHLFTNNIDLPIYLKCSLIDYITRFEHSTNNRILHNIDTVIQKRSEELKYEAENGDDDWDW